MPSLAQSIITLIAAAMPQPNIVEGIIATVEPPTYDDDFVLTFAGRVTVTGLGEDPIACDWSANFDLELSAMGAELVGRAVEVHLIAGQPVIAYSKVAGVKP